MVIYCAWCSWWMWPEGGHSPWRGTHGGTGGLVSCYPRGHILVQCAPEGWAPWYGANLKQLLNSCSLFKTCMELVLEGWHSTGGTSHWSEGQQWTWRSVWDEVFVIVFLFISITSVSFCQISTPMAYNASYSRVINMGSQNIVMVKYIKYG